MKKKSKLFKLKDFYNARDSQLFWKRNIDEWWCKLWRFYKWHGLSLFSGERVGIGGERDVKWEAISLIEKVSTWVNK